MFFYSCCCKLTYSNLTPCMMHIEYWSTNICGTVPVYVHSIHNHNYDDNQFITCTKNYEISCRGKLAAGKLFLSPKLILFESPTYKYFLVKSKSWANSVFESKLVNTKTLSLYESKPAPTGHDIVFISFAEASKSVP